jgi:hypothetical protein
MDTPRPKELIELQEKFAVHYKQEVVFLKEQHAKEVAQLKADYETEVQSLTKKFSDDIAVLEDQMAAETTQHGVLATLHCVVVYSMLIYFGVAGRILNYCVSKFVVLCIYLLITS